jgi:hypothetical protein
MTMPAEPPRLTAATARVGMRVVCVDPSGRRELRAGEMYEIAGLAGSEVALVGIRGTCFLPSRFVPAAPPASAQPAWATWHTGAPPKPWSEEWFIAETIYGDRVVLRSLPDEWTYDFKTADETYIKADRIKRWMQFFDSSYVAYVPPPPPVAGEGMPEFDAWWFA